MKTNLILAQGAEAIIQQEGNFIVKNRIPKSYRIKELDEKIRKHRTKEEKKLLEKASKIISSPNPLPLENSYQIKMPFIKGKKLSEHLDSLPLTKQKEICKEIGKNIAKIHNADIIHGDLTTSNMILVNQEDNIPKFKKNLLDLKGLNLPPTEYAVFGSSPLAIHRIRDSEDIVVIVKQELWNKLVKKYPVEEDKLIKIKSVEIYKNWLPWIDNTNKLIDDAEIFEDIRIVKLKYVLLWKKAFNREKDKRDVELIEQYLKRGDNSSFPLGWAGGEKKINNSQIFFIDFGLGFISIKVEDKAVDLHLLKQALEARHFKNWEILFNAVLEGYAECKDAKKVLERLKAIEKRGRYKF